MMLNTILLMGVAIVGFSSTLGLRLNNDMLGSADRFIRSSVKKPECPSSPIKRRVKPNRTDRTNGSCTKGSVIIGDSCRGMKVSCCTNTHGENICVRVKAFLNKMQQRKNKNRKNKKSPPKVNNFANLLDDAPVTIQSPNCPKQNTTVDAEGKTVVECVDYYLLPDCSAAGDCEEGRICCEDPCYTQKRNENVPRYCYPDTEAEATPPTAFAMAPDPVTSQSLNCPKQNTIADAEGKTVVECVDYYLLLNCSTPDDCEEGRICCADPCYTPQVNEDIPMYCYPDKEAEAPPPPPAPAALAMMADGAVSNCPSFEEVCARLPEGACNTPSRLMNCPAYDVFNKPCEENDDCGATLTGETSPWVCCPDFCPGSESSLCMLRADFTGPPPMIETMQDEAPIVPPAVPGRQCPAYEANTCITVDTTHGGMVECTDGVCNDPSKMCCKISDCGFTDKAQYCIDPVVGEELPKGCPVPYHVRPFTIEGDDCSEGGCFGDAICCPLTTKSESGGSFCFTPNM